MKKHIRLAVALCLGVTLFSCGKEMSKPEDPTTPSNPPAGGNNGNGNGSCNDVVMKVTRMYNPINVNESATVTYDASGKVTNIKIGQFLHPEEDITLRYDANNKVTGSISRPSVGNGPDTLTYHYNTAGRIDTIYSTNRGRCILQYDGSGRVIKSGSWGNINPDGTEYGYYYQTTYDDVKNTANVIRYETPWGGSAPYKKESEDTFQYDSKKNPFASLAIHCYYMDVPTWEINILKLMGAHNVTDDTNASSILAGGGPITSGFSYKYNSNCYPDSAYATISGMIIMPGSRADRVFEYKK